MAEHRRQDAQRQRSLRPQTSEDWSRLPAELEPPSSLDPAFDASFNLLADSSETKMRRGNVRSLQDRAYK
jgi:hypothetical protein